MKRRGKDEGQAREGRNLHKKGESNWRWEKSWWGRSGWDTGKSDRRHRQGERSTEGHRLWEDDDEGTGDTGEGRKDEGGQGRRTGDFATKVKAFWYLVVGKRGPLAY